MDEPRTHYQISLTARQAVGLFVGLLLSLGVAFFFGLMAGLSGRERAAAGPERAAEGRIAAGSESLPPVETAAPIPAPASRRDLPPLSGAPASAGEPTQPPTLQTFEDGAAEEAAPAARAASTAAPKPTASARSDSPSVVAAGRVWVQVASVSSRGEADAMSARLKGRGYRAQVVADGSAKGRLRVRIGPYRTTEDARKIAEKLRKQERIKSPWVVTEAK